MSSNVALSRIDGFRASLTALVAADAIADADLASFAVDGMVPALVVMASNEQELAAAIAQVHAFGLAAVPYGMGNHVSIGNVLAGYDVALSTARLDKIVAHEPADLTVTVQPGVRLSRLREALRAHNQFLPLDPPCPDATVGGLIASAAQGPLRHSFGTVRDWLIGIRVVHADGSVSKAGGRVVKNVTGYEMTKLYAGSLGTLGIISEATFKLMPSPSDVRTVAASFHSPHAAATFALAAFDAGLALQAAELLSPPAAFTVLGEASWTMILRAAGTAGAVKRSYDEITTLAEGVRGRISDRDDDAWSRWNDVFTSTALSLRVSVPSSSVADAIEMLDRRFSGTEAVLSATPSAGLVRANLRAAREDRVAAFVGHAREIAARFHGYAVVDAAPPSYKREHDVFGPLRPDFAIMQRMKDEFDARRTLSPGRFVGRL